MVRDSVGIAWVWIDFCGLPDRVFIRGKEREREILGKRIEKLCLCMYCTIVNNPGKHDPIGESSPGKRFVRATPTSNRGL